MLAEPEFWVAVAFVIFVALVYKRAAQTVTTMLDRRSDAIRAQIEEARQLREEAQRRLDEYRRREREALKEAEEIIARARQEAERHQAQARADLEAALARRREQALDKIARAEADAVRQVREMSSDLAVAATRRVLAEELAGPQGAALINQAIAELPQKLH